MAKKKTPVDVFVDGLDALVDGRGWNADHDKARKLLEAAPRLLAGLKKAIRHIDRACDGNEDINQDHEIGNACRAIEAAMRGLS